MLKYLHRIKKKLYKPQIRTFHYHIKKINQKMKFFVFLLLVTLINFSVTNAEKPACRKWEQQVTINLTKIFGHWHTFLQDKLLVKENDTCSEYTIEWNATLHAVDLINTQNYNDKSNKFIKGRAHKTAFPGVYDVVLDNGLMVVIRVGAMTDDFILFVGCFRNNGKIDTFI